MLSAEHQFQKLLPDTGGIGRPAGGGKITACRMQVCRLLRDLDVRPEHLLDELVNRSGEPQPQQGAAAALPFQQPCDVENDIIAPPTLFEPVGGVADFCGVQRVCFEPEAGA